MPIKYYSQATPNPNAMKFILEKNVRNQGKITFQLIENCLTCPMAEHLLTLEEVTQVHFFENVVTVTQNGSATWSILEGEIVDIIQEDIGGHDPNFIIPEVKRPTIEMTPELEAIDAILTKEIRPGLQGDGGDLRLEGYDPEGKRLIISYEGACNTCPSATLGTLYAIKGVLRKEFDPEIDVIAG